MTGWNLPPGCSVRDLPGNTPEDEAAEALAEAVYNTLQLPDSRETDEIAERVIALCEKIWADAYQQAQADEAMIRDRAKSEGES